MSGFDVCEECKEGPQLLCPQCWKCKKKCCKCWDKPEVEEKMTEEEKELQEVDEWFRREVFHLWRDKSSLEIAKEAYLKGKETSRQKMREEMERLEVECDNQSSTIEMYQATLKECEEKVSQVESKSEELQKRLEIAIDGYGKAAEKVEQLESELASLNGHCLIMYQEGQHEHDLMEEWHQKALKLEEWQEWSMKDYLNLHVVYKQLEDNLAQTKEIVDATEAERERLSKLLIEARTEVMRLKEERND